MRGQYPNCMAWLVSEKAPEITACEAITVATVASKTSGISSISLGAIRKKGLSIAVGSLRISAP
jgi:hypothetical protein